MVNEKSPPDFRARVDLNSCERSTEMRNQAGGCEPPPLVEGMGDAVKPDCMETRVTEKDLHNVFRCGISVFNGSDVFLQPLPHGQIRLSLTLNTNSKIERNTMAKQQNPDQNSSSQFLNMKWR
jgi:hypothetical protein